MAEKLFSFRWDIDHRACMTDGIPKIQSLCREFGVPNTFFVNMGRSTNLKEWLGKGLKGTKAKLADMEAINLIEKIGWPRFILETIVSRPVGRSFVSSLQSLQADGHELGLHGGSDHVVWSRKFAQLPEDYIVADVSKTLRFFESVFGRPTGFTSPGFKSDDRIMRLVQDLGFEYHGDAIGGKPHRSEADGETLDHWTIPVTVCGPRTIPYLEWHGAKKTPIENVMEDFQRILDEEQLVILYGHPCYEGVEIETLRRIFEAVDHSGFSFVTHADLAKRLADNQLSLN